MIKTFWRDKKCRMAVSKWTDYIATTGEKIYRVHQNSKISANKLNALVNFHEKPASKEATRRVPQRHAYSNHVERVPILGENY